MSFRRAKNLKREKNTIKCSSRADDKFLCILLPVKKIELQKQLKFMLCQGDDDDSGGRDDDWTD